MDTDTIDTETLRKNYDVWSEVKDKVDLRKAVDAYRNGQQAVGEEIEKLRKENTDLKDQLKRKDADSMATFEIMERAVKGDPDVQAMRDALAKTKSRVLHTLCLENTEYLMGWTAYCTSVKRAYDKDVRTDARKDDQPTGGGKPRHAPGKGPCGDACACDKEGKDG